MVATREVAVSAVPASAEAGVKVSAEVSAGADARPAGLSPAVRRPRRADARRNYDRLLDVARDAVAEHGAEASLDDIARKAGVGSATLYRHFPTRAELLEAVFYEHVEGIYLRAQELLDSPTPGAALGEWLRAVLEHSIRNRGLAASLRSALEEAGGGTLSWCHGAMRAAAGSLLTRAQAAGEIRADVAVTDLLRLINGLALANVEHPDGEVSAQRMLGFVLDGFRVV
jgi:AcrR family transcriptional regulator